MTTKHGTSRRALLLRTGIGIAGTVAATALPTLAATAPERNPALMPDPFAGVPMPDPIPYVNPENGQHTFPPVPFAEPSNINNFRGQVGVANIAGTGQDGNGRPLTFGGPSMDLRFQRGEYVTMDGAHHQGTFVHI